MVRHALEAAGWLVGSRRHIGGAGDWLAVNRDGNVWLVEVKATKGMWDGFGPADRKALISLAEEIDATPVMAYRLSGNNIRWVFKSGFPPDREEGE